jgi:hypothetical protein
MSLKMYQLSPSFLSWKDWVNDMGLSEPSTWLCVSRGANSTKLWRTYQECAGDQNKDAVLTHGLCVNGVGTVLNLLEGEVLQRSAELGTGGIA